ncbi:MAG TPA: HAMP domain-containing protein [Thiotrichaceae bacterium]|jgi:nitrogen fixation/metabolism regulation signal transduction histidine kinase|nr:HAMP domain-containing protein [Thiotrichaceae bacterium]HIM07665.1 HAMP domain-containing protein [Gammaproteobacteria bacterium]
MARMGNKTMKKGGKLILVIGACLFFFMLASLLMMSQTLQNPELFDRYYWALLIFNALGLITFVILILINLKRLIRQLKNRVIGSRMTVKMVMIFSLLSVTPVLIVYYFSLDFLHRGIDSWFDLRVEQALDDSLELSRLALDVRMRELLNTTEKVAEELSKTTDAELPFDIDHIRERINANELILLTKKGSIIASSSNSIKSLVPNIPDSNILLQLSQSNSYIGLDIIKDNNLLIRAAINLPAININKEARIVQALYPISDRITQLSDSVQSSYFEYKELSYLREELKISFIIILTLVLLFSIFSAVWAAFYSARQLVTPVKNLAKGTRAIAEGNYSTRLPVPGNDELGALVASFNDMTDKISQATDTARQSQQEAESQRAYLETVLSRLSSGVMVFNKEGILEKSNISAAQILQLDIEALIHENISSLAKERHNLNVFFDSISLNIEERLDDWREQITLSDKTGAQILIINGAMLTALDGSTNGYVIVFDEVTALIQGQRDAAWSEMARRLAHEIKNPLTPIQLAAERLRNKYLNKMDATDAELLDRMTNTIIQQVETMKDMVNDFSDYARSPEFNPEEIRIEHLIQEGLDLFTNTDNENEIETDIESNLPTITGDEKKLRQVFNNLLTNAIDANTASDDNHLKVSAKIINVDENDMLEIRIIDSGSGIEPSVINSLFEPYITTKQKGTGLGLAIVKKIIDEHSGSVWLENNKEQNGACAVIRLLANISINKTKT